MRKRIARGCLLCLWLAAAGAPAAETGQAASHTLLARSSEVPSPLPLTTEQRHWLAGKQVLLLGTSAPDYPPFDITAGNRDYQGLTADYAGLIGAALGLPIKVERFASRQEAVDALIQGRIDLLGSANGFEAADQQVVLSRPYAIDQPVLVTREDENRPLDMGLEGMRLSMLYHYLPLDEVHAAYPKATLLSYPSYQNALNAVAFDEADVFIGDTISTHYLINQGHLPNIKMANFGKHEPVGFSFAVQRDNKVLLGLLDATLDRLSSATREDIFKRWSAGSASLLTDRKLHLSPREERWLQNHPTMRVVVNESAAPLTFFDNHGNFRGISADLLELIRLRTGLRFEIQSASGVSDMLKQVREGRADVIAAISSGGERGSLLNISRPYLENSYVLVTRTGTGQPASLEQLAGRSIAVTRDSPMTELLATHYPYVQQSVTESAFHSSTLLASGQVDAAVMALINANFVVASNAGLTIRNSVGAEPATFSMATSNQALELASILDKALLSISPEELGVINSRWRGYSAHDDAYWQTYQQLILQVVIGTSLMLLLSLVWNARLRRQIKQRQAAERALNDQLAFMRALLNGTPHPMYVRDRDGCLQSCNDSYLEAVNAQSEEIIGKRLHDSLFTHGDVTRQIEADYCKVMTHGKPLIQDRPLRLQGRELTIYHWILPYHDSLGEIQGIIGGWIDISDRRKLVQDLSLAKQQADDANRAKSTFLATISHEIRTPMNAVIGMLELALKRAEQGLVDRSAIEVAYHSAKDMLGLIGDILDIARIESGHMTLAAESVSLDELVESVGRVFDGLARQKGLLLEVLIEPSSRRQVLLDPLRFKQVLSNLVSNAIKFTEQGYVRVHLDVRDAETGLLLDLNVCDSGIGIHPHDQPCLFSPFAQIDPHSDTGRSGTGLGLVISRNLCELMGGQLKLDSLQGVGTRVRLLMPLQDVDPSSAVAPLPPRRRPPDPRLRVLVVDDHPANLLLMAQQLSYLGLFQRGVGSGEEGLRAWRQGRFDVLIVDCNMPRMNGYQLAATVRSEERRSQRARCTILAYTANAQPEVRQRCLAAGMDDCLLKPISLQALSERLAVVPGPGPAVGSPDPPCDLQGLSVIVGESAIARGRLLETLRQSLGEDLRVLLAIDPDSRADALKDQAHKIISAARMLEAAPLEHACEELQAACVKQLPPALLRQRRQRVARHMRRVENALAGQLDREVPREGAMPHGAKQAAMRLS
ncbi:Virulence sensor protein BvgS [Pseudomonas fluorescens]|uniref:transporter substrate-binding domain-containing protein n=1 Tax=Pseudomonas fluorescens TaxID=294 RepID=UPI001251449B|nr:transporter substrate-binding domain-containing protein [Pseudomonas fluorescens]CAG8865468.1 Virulence sensor protein BvgS [Pseudomonas fluorescens]